MKKQLIIILFMDLRGCSNKRQKYEVLNLYSKRHYQVDKDLFKKFEEENNIKINVKASSDELMRIKTEGDKCPADLLITVDAGKLYKAAKEILLDKTIDIDK